VMILNTKKKAICLLLNTRQVRDKSQIDIRSTRKNTMGIRDVIKPDGNMAQLSSFCFLQDGYKHSVRVPRRRPHQTLRLQREGGMRLQESGYLAFIFTDLPAAGAVNKMAARTNRFTCPVQNIFLQLL